ncbi:ankyrin repeat-containing protein [Aspergillus bombycis]|uniref:Ankyrin repeat-containing protein n=1 Tax=Aspergillus bombycis TaxID=109264 RepID=A0A1F7ZSW3_9EURO|nr:ankyrin repeat-containing protein [Aspergillus bombycis]OGM42532.1 ankyrin repeat-containing protein [Aspergillus bombycis]
MSADYSAEDLDAIVELASTVQQHFVDVPDQYKPILDDVKRLPNKLRQNEEEDSDSPVGEQGEPSDDISKSCRDLLHELNTYLGHLYATKALSQHEKGGFVDCKTTIGDTILFLAAKQGFTEIVRFLLEQGISIDPKDRAGRTPLHHAVVKDQKEVVRILLAAGGDIETTDLADHILLMFAAPRSDNRKNRSGHTPLIAAIEAGNEAMVRLLLDAGADPNHHTDDYAPLTSAIRAHSMSIFTMLLDKVSDLNHADGRGETPLMHAAKWHNGMAELLLERGARWDVENRNGETAMSIASQHANEPLLRLLLENIPGQEYVNAKGHGLLHFAVMSNREGGDESIVRFLLAREGLTHDRKVADAQSGLHGAAWRGYTAILDILLEIDGVSIDGKDEDGYTALWLAVRWGREATVELLLDKYRASTEVSNGEIEWTALHGAGRPRSNSAILGDKDRMARLHDDIAPKMVPLLLEADGVDIDSRDTMGRTPLFWALLSAIYLVGALEMVDMYEASIQLLLEYGARVDHRDESGRTPIFYAAMVKRAALVQMLLEKGAEPDCKDADGRTPLSYAVEPFNVGWLAEYKGECEDEWEPEWSGDQLSKVVTALLAQGADPDCQDPKGLTPLSRAEKKLEEGNEVLVLLRNASARGS